MIHEALTPTGPRSSRAGHGAIMMAAGLAADTRGSIAKIQEVDRMNAGTTKILTWIPGTIVQGQGVASGKNPVDGGVRGTIRAQRPFFRDAGVAIEHLHDGTINVDISPHEFRPIKSSFTLPNVRWHATYAPETFSLFACSLRIFERDFMGYVYYPHPETKPVKFPGHHMAEIWTEYIEGVRYGQRVMLGADPELLSVSRKD